MLSCKVYLTKSHDVAFILADSLKNRLGEGEQWVRSGSGMVNEDSHVPPMYHNTDYFYAYVEYKSEKPRFELVFA